MTNTMTNSFTVFYKQIIDTLKNKTVLIQFLMFPLMTLIMNNAINIEGLSENYFVELFSSMFIGMAPLVVSCAIVAEEKENGTLLALNMSGVRPLEYLLGVGSYVWLSCMLGGVVMSLSGNYATHQRIAFLLVMAVGICISLILGTSIGIVSRSQMQATSLSVPMMMVFSFLPMISMFNEQVKKLAHYTYTYQLQTLLSCIGSTDRLSTSSGISISSLLLENKESLLILGANFIVVLCFFIFTYKKNGLD
ncbi:MAG: ABC transporter permease [Spirochaetaceae bacterium]|nr:ABC transporter permease [Spirochaetaceae bacterium]